MKKRAIALALSALVLTGLVGCGSKSEGGQTPAEDGAKGTLLVHPLLHRAARLAAPHRRHWL